MPGNCKIARAAGYDEQPIDDAAVDAYAATITARWTESLRQMEAAR